MWYERPGPPTSRDRFIHGFYQGDLWTDTTARITYVLLDALEPRWRPLRTS